MNKSRLLQGWISISKVFTQEVLHLAEKCIGYFQFRQKKISMKKRLRKAIGTFT